MGRRVDPLRCGERRYAAYAEKRRRDEDVRGKRMLKLTVGVNVGRYRSISVSSVTQLSR